MKSTTTKALPTLILTALLILLLTACSGGGSSGGSSAGTGSSSVEGTVTSVSLAMLRTDPLQSPSFPAWIIRILVPVQVAHADGGVDGILVDLDGMQTTTNSSGYFRFDGVSPGTHQISFSKNGQVARTSVIVGDSELVTMQNITMTGEQAHVQSYTHSPMTNGQTGPMGDQGPSRR